MLRISSLLYRSQLGCLIYVGKSHSRCQDTIYKASTPSKEGVFSPGAVLFLRTIVVKSEEWQAQRWSQRYAEGCNIRVDTS